MPAYPHLEIDPRTLRSNSLAPFSSPQLLQRREPFLNKLLNRHKVILRNRNAFPITETELNVIAALASMGLKRTPTNG